MALVAVAVTLGTPNFVGQVPITTSNLAASIAQAVTDLAALATLITTAQTNATAADNAMATLVTDVNTDVTNTTTADNDAATDVTNTGAVVTDVATAITDYNNAFKDSAGNLLSLFNLGASNAYTYTDGTMQFGGSGTNPSSLSVAQINAVIALLNTAGTALLATQTAATTAQTSAGTTKTATAAAKSSAAASSTQAGTTKTATALSVTSANALSTATVSADLIAAQAIIAAANVLIQTDTGVATNVALLNGALVSALAFVRGSGILPT